MFGSHFLSKHGVAVILTKILGNAELGPPSSMLAAMDTLNVKRLVPAPTRSPQQRSQLVRYPWFLTPREKSSRPLFTTRCGHIAQSFFGVFIVSSF